MEETFFLLDWALFPSLSPSRQFSSSGKSALTTLTCEEEVAMFDCCVDDDVARVAVVSEGGGLFLYQFSLSPLPSSPLTCSYAIQFVNSPPKVMTHR